MRPYVQNPERWVVERPSTVISCSDQVPVWLKASPDDALQPKSTVEGRRLAKRQRTSRQKVAAGEKQTDAAALQPRTTVRTPGNPANSRYRVTLVARQLVLNYFDERQCPKGPYRRSLHLRLDIAFIAGKK
jgi:hypothetical protein